MTTLIYRGITHTGTNTTAPRSAQDLLYRGVAHDGLAASAPRVTRTAQMCYRGVRHIARTPELAVAPSPARSSAHDLPIAA